MKGAISEEEALVEHIRSLRMEARTTRPSRL
ncbi:hypothetical protein GCK32_013522 [Trichostrongylus colubriformis]|uniref:Uncharacterized protein n=1 Tax=Trichostrongylus colubriformis TaxID=6319 RepID=A0AAN8EYB3_TRICO